MSAEEFALHANHALADVRSGPVAGKDTCQ